MEKFKFGSGIRNKHPGPEKLLDIQTFYEFKYSYFLISSQCYWSNLDTRKEKNNRFRSGLNLRMFKNLQSYLKVLSSEMDPAEIRLIR
jgi:hypothetical protein